MVDTTPRQKIIYLMIAADAVGGTEIAVRRQALALEAYYDVEIVSLFRITPKGGTGPANLTVRYLMNEDGGGQRYGALFQDIAKDPQMMERVDMVLSEYFSGIKSERNILALISAFPVFLRPLSLFYNGGAKILHQEHRRTETRGSSLRDVLIYGWICDGIMVLSQRTQVALKGHFGIHGPDIRLFRNSIDRQFIRDAPDPPRIVLAGRLTSEKQCDQAIAAFSEIRERLSNAELLICGDGPQRGALETAVHELGLSGCVQFLGIADMDSVWPKVSVGILTSRHEATPLVIMEANAHGVPYVSYDCGDGVRQLIAHGRTGLIVGQGDATGLAEGVIELLSSPEKLSVYSASAFAELKQYETWPVSLDLVSILKGVPKRSLKRKRRIIEKWLVRTPSSHQIRSSPIGPGLQESSRNLSRLGFRILDRRGCYPAEGVSPLDARNKNATLVIEAAREAGAKWFVQPRTDWTKVVIFVERVHRLRVLSAIRAKAADIPCYVEALFDGDTHSPAEHISMFSEENQDGIVKGYRIFLRYATTDASVEYSSQHGSVIRFAERKGTSGWKFSNKRGGHTLVMSKEAAWRDSWLGDLPSLSQFVAESNAWKFSSVDAVYIDKDAGGQSEDSFSGIADDLLRMSIRSLRMNAPWTGNIFIIRDRPRPDWMTPENKFLRLVQSKQLFNGTNHDGNASAVEAVLYRIPELSDPFLLVDARMIINSPLSMENFFSDTGCVKVRRSGSLASRHATRDPRSVSRYHTAVRIEEVVGYSYFDEYRYAPLAFRKDILDDLWNQFGEDLARTVRRSEPDVDDFVLLTGGFQEYARATHRAELCSLDVSRQVLASKSPEAVTAELFGRKSKVIFLAGRPTDPHLWEQRSAALMRKFFNPSDCETTN